MTTAPETTTDPRAEYIAGLRQLSDILEANPELALPLDGKLEGIPIAVYLTNDSEDPRADMAAWTRALPGTKSKTPSGAEGEYFTIRTRLGGPNGLHFKVLANRGDVCERIVIGTREVTEEKPDPALLAELPLVTETRTEEIVEWRCSSILSEASA